MSRFAQEVRFYALAVLITTLATLLLLRALDRPSWPRWAAYAACLALLGYIELVALAVVAGHIAGSGAALVAGPRPAAAALPARRVPAHAESGGVRPAPFGPWSYRFFSTGRTWPTGSKGDL